MQMTILAFTSGVGSLDSENSCSKKMPSLSSEEGAFYLPSDLMSDCGGFFKENMKTRYVCVILPLFAVAIETATAQVTDVAQKVSDALTAVGPIPVTTYIQVPRQVRVCDMPAGMPDTGGGGFGSTPDVRCKSQTVYDSVPRTDTRLLQASNIRIVSAQPIVFDTATRTEIPDQLSVDDQLIQDCTGAPPLSQQVMIQKAFQRSSSVSLQQSVAHTQGTQLNSSFKVGSDLSFSAGVQLSFSDTATTATTRIDSTQETITRSRSASTTVQPGTATIVELKVWPVQYVVPFKTTVTVDADLSPNDRHFQLLSQVLSDPASRTFPISGTLTVDDASEGFTVEYLAPYDPTQCTGPTKHKSIVIDNYRPASNAKWMIKSK